MNYKVACLDVWTPSVRAEVQRVAPAHFQLVFADSYEPAHQASLVIDAHFIVPGFAAVDPPLLLNANKLRLVHKWGIGIDAIDQNALKQRGIGLAITSGGNAGPVAELALALMLSVYRRLPYVQRTLREGLWVTSEMRETCLQVTGKTIGLIGFGHIARALAKKLAGFDVRIVYYDPRRADANTESALKAEFKSMDEVLAISDILSLHLPLNAATQHIVNDQFLQKMKDGAVLINTARGGIVDENALMDALQSGKLRGAGLDAFELEPPAANAPLLQLEQVVCTPHIGGGVFDNVAPVANHVFGNIMKYLNGESISAEDLILAAIPFNAEV
jgi:D-3-phosphoglycerate dehydrogenase